MRKDNYKKTIVKNLPKNPEIKKKINPQRELTINQIKKDIEYNILFYLLVTTY